MMKRTASRPAATECEELHGVMVVWEHFLIAAPITTSNCFKTHQEIATVHSHILNELYY